MLRTPAMRENYLVKQFLFVKLKTLSKRIRSMLLLKYPLDFTEKNAIGSAM